MLTDAALARLIGLLLAAWRRIARQDNGDAESLGVNQAALDLGIIDGISDLVDPYAEDASLAYELAALNALAGQFQVAVRIELAKGLREGFSVDEVARRLRDATNGGMSRLDVIARTEMNRAANIGRFSAWRRSGVVKRKQFVATLDDRVRPDHLAAHGEVVLLDEAFTIGAAAGYLVPPLAPNCRCTAVPITALTSEADIQDVKDAGTEAMDALGLKSAVLQHDPKLRALEDHHARRLRTAAMLFLGDVVKHASRPGAHIVDQATP